MLRSEKQEFINQLEELFKNSNSMIITHYHGLTVTQVTQLRKSLRNNNSGFKVVKNTLSKIAIEKSGVLTLSKLLTGPTAIAYSEDPILAAKSVVEFAKTNDRFKIIGGIVNNQILDSEGVQQLAKLPSLNELRGKIVGLLKAPATKIAGTIQAPAAQLARVFQAYANKQ